MLLVVATLALAKKPPPPAPPSLEDVAAQLVGRALLSSEAYDELAVLCDDIGHRIAGSAALDEAIAWGLAAMRADGLANVRAEPVTVPVWLRGEEHAEIVSPEPRRMEILALGHSIATPPGGLVAEVLVATSFEDLEAKKAQARGKIVLWDVPFTTYGETVAYRGGGAHAAARVGAVASLVRSVTSESLDTPHTGAQRIVDGSPPPVPAAAVTLETATQIRRWSDRGVPVSVKLELTSRAGPDAPSANVVGEVVGRSLPSEIVVLGCHLDSWDVGQGAQDDGAGCAIVMAAAALVRELPVAPKRTVRVVLYTNEESGLAGGRRYAVDHASEVHHAALEVDTGSGQPLGFRLTPGRGDDPVALRAHLEQVAALLASVGATAVSEGYGGADIGPLTDLGVRSLGLEQDTTDYWPIHHTDADTFDKIDPVLLARNVAATAVMAWALADE